MLIETGQFAGLTSNGYGAILADPPWQWTPWSDKGLGNRATSNHYETRPLQAIIDLPVGQLAAPNCVLFMWITWPQLFDAQKVIDAWGFTYKTCAFSWMKAHAGQIELFRNDIDPFVGLGYWTRANSEVCLLATRGRPKRLNADVRQGIIEPRREHSRKPDCVAERIERLVAGPYIELFARTTRRGWDCWGNQTDMFPAFDWAAADS